MIRAAAALLGAALLAAQAAQPPKVRSGVELVTVDVEVVGRDGEPVAGLLPADFEVRINGKPRRVVSADFVRYDAPPTAAAEPAEPAAAAPAAAPPRRLYLLAVDEQSFDQGSLKAAMQAASRFVERLRPGDLVGLYSYPTGAAHVDFTSDHAAVKAELPKLTGLFDPPAGAFHLSLTEVVDITAGDQRVFMKVVERECAPADPTCPPAVRGEAVAIGAFLESRIAQSLGGLRALIEGLSAIPERKTVVLVSGGLIANDRIGGRPDAAGFTLEVGRQAARANVSLYVLHMDRSFSDAMSGRDPMSRRAPDVESMFRDGNLTAMGLEMVAGAAGGAVMRVMAGTGDSAFDRVLRETAAHYLLGVEVEEPDRDGRTHRIAVRLKRRGATLRSRTMVMIPRPGAVAGEPAPPEEEAPQEPAPVLDKPDARTPPLQTILRTAAKYLDDYEREVSALVSEETYLQKTPEPDRITNTVSRQLRSDMLIIPDAVVGWLGFRDVFEVDGEPVRNRSERLTALFTRPLDDAMSQARRIVVESTRFNLRSDIFRTINMPMMALRFLRFVDQHRARFSLAGTRLEGGTRVAVVKFEERAKPRMIESTDDAAARGTFWIEPASGRVVSTELLFHTGKGASRVRVRVRVGYAAAPALGTWVPVSMDEDYRMGKGALALEGHATYANFRRFKVETSTTIKK